MIRRLLFAALMLMTLVPLPAGGAIGYSVLDIGHYDSSGNDDMYMNALNDLGQATGQSVIGNVFLIFYDGASIDSITNSENGIPYDLNNNGEIVGTLHDVNGESRGFIYRNGTLSHIPDAWSAHAINDAGQVVGMNYDGNEYVYTNGVMQDLGAPVSGGGVSSAWGINESGQIIGNFAGPSQHPQGYLYENGAWTPVGTLGGNYSFVHDINSLGQIVGASNLDPNAPFSFAGPLRPFLYHDGVMTELTSPDFTLTSAVAINDAGMILGNGNGPVVYRDGGWQVLRDLIDPGLGITLLTPLDINEHGQVMVLGTDWSGGYDTYILTPIPEPAAAGVLAMLTLAAAATRRRERAVARRRVISRQAERRRR